MMVKKTDSNRVIPISSYIKLGFIVIVTVLVVFMFRNWYISRINYQLSIPIVTEVLLSEINSNEVYNYIRENENAVLYMGVASNEECREFEVEFNDLIRERSLENEITYLNISKDNNKKNFIKQFNKFYGTNILGYPSLIIFEDGKIKDTISVKIGNKLNVLKVEEFLDKNEVVPIIYD